MRYDLGDGALFIGRLEGREDIEGNRTPIWLRR